MRPASVAAVEPITRLAPLPEAKFMTGGVGANRGRQGPTKAMFVCDLCLFSVDLTSVAASPTADAAHRNDMLIGECSSCLCC